MSESQETRLETMPLFAFCRELGAEMALERPAGISAEHRHSNDKREEPSDV